MHDHQMTRTIHTDRIRDMERNLRHRMAAEGRSGNSVRRAFGHTLIQIGSVIAADGRLRTTT